MKNPSEWSSGWVRLFLVGKSALSNQACVAISRLKIVRTISFENAPIHVLTCLWECCWGKAFRRVFGCDRAKDHSSTSKRCDINRPPHVGKTHQNRTTVQERPVGFCRPSTTTAKKVQEGGAGVVGVSGALRWGPVRKATPLTR